METAVAKKIQDLNADYSAVAGKPVTHFFCPILYRDEKVPLCKAHLVNTAFGGPKKWTVQRKDVDNFYGSIFESDFVDLRHKGRRPDEVLADASLSKRMRPEFVVDDRRVEHYVPKGPVPRDYTSLVVVGETGPIHLALKMHPSETESLRQRKWQVQIERDLRIPAMVSLLKAAHLTLFHMLGYQYGLSPGGHFLGRYVLGEFFLANTGRPRPEVLAAAHRYFREYAPMVRPMPNDSDQFSGTAEDGQAFMCLHDDVLWGMVVIIRVSQSLHGVLVPVFGSQAGNERFLAFIEGADERIKARLVRFAGDHWDASRQLLDLVWPKTGLLYPE